MHHSGNDYDLLDSTPTLEESWLASVAEMISKLLLDIIIERERDITNTTRSHYIFYSMKSHLNKMLTTHKKSSRLLHIPIYP